MSAHTPGPWTLAEVTDRSIKHLCPVGPDGLSILTVVHDEGTPFGTVYLDADARLIAAAPDLLHALQTLLHACHCDDQDAPDRFDACAANARDVIAKATAPATAAPSDADKSGGRNDA